MSFDANILIVPAAAPSPGGAAPARGQNADQPARAYGRDKSFDDHLAEAGSAPPSKAPDAPKPKNADPKTAKSHAQQTSSSDKQADKAPDKTATATGDDAAKTKTSGKTASDETVVDGAKSKDAKNAKSKEADAAASFGPMTAADASDPTAKPAATVIAAAITSSADASSDQADGDETKVTGATARGLAAVSARGDGKVLQTGQPNDAAVADADKKAVPTSTGGNGETSSTSKPTAQQQVLVQTLIKSDAPSDPKSKRPSLPSESSQTAVNAVQKPLPDAASAGQAKADVSALKNAVKPDADPATPTPQATVAAGSVTDDAKAVKLKADAAVTPPELAENDDAKDTKGSNKSDDKSGTGQFADAKPKGQIQTASMTNQSAAANAKLQDATQKADALLPAKPEPAPAGQTLTPSSSTPALPDPSAAQALAQAQTAQAPAAAAQAKILMDAYGLAQDVGQQVAVQLTKAALDGLNRFSIQLHPADLGRVNVRLDMSQDGHVTAMVTADRHDTLNLLQRDSRALERSLQDIGLKLDAGGMQFSLKNQGDSYGQAAWSGTTDAGSGFTTPEPSLDPAVIAAAATTNLSNRMLDIRV